jgi:hypothetical protein
MAIGAPSRRALGPLAPARGASGVREHGAVAGTVVTRPRLRRYPARDSLPLAAALAGPLAAPAVLRPFRGSWSNTNAALLLLLVVVVVAVAAAGTG